MAAKKFKTYNDLRGATFGAISLTSGVTFALRQVLKVKGLEYPRDYKLLVIGGTPQTYAAPSKHFQALPSWPRVGAT